MAGRVRWTVIGFGLVFMIGLTSWLLAGAPGSQQTASESPVGFAGALRPDMPTVDFAGLVDESGEPAPALRGDVTVVTFLYTTCEDTCPLMAQQIRGALDRLDDPPRSLAISVDPKGDDQASARTFLAKQRLTGRMSFLVGPAEALQRQWKAYAIQPQLDDIEHSASVVLVDAQGRQRVGFPAGHLTPEGLADDIERLRSEAGSPPAASSAG